MSAALDAPTEAVVPAGTYQDAWPVLRRDGWSCVIPLRPGTKFPPPSGFTGWHGRDTSGADCMEFDELRAYRGTTQTALRLAPGEAGIDVDAYGTKTGAATLAKAEALWGRLPPGPWSSARDDGVSGIRLFRIPPGVVLRDTIEFPDTLDGQGEGGIEIIQHHHRYAVVSPSIHPTTATPYTWRNTFAPGVHPHPNELPWLPDAWVEALRNDNAKPGEAAATSAVVDRFERERVTSNGGGYVRGVVATFEKLVRGGKSRHDSLVQAMCMGAREAGAGRFPASEVLPAVGRAFLAHVLPDGSRTEGMARREAESAWAYGVGQVAALTPAECTARCAPSKLSLSPNVVPLMPRVRAGLGENGAESAQEPRSEESEDGTATGERSSDPTNTARFLLPDEVWQFSPVMRHIHQAAMARIVCPDAVLHSLLARVASLVHHGTRVDTGKRPSVLSHYSALIAASGGGKTEADTCARELLAEWQAGRHGICGEGGYIDDVPASGEGLIDAFIGDREVDELDEKGNHRTRTEKAQIRHNALFVTDEGRKALAIDSRKGSTLMGTLCELWSGIGNGGRRVGGNETFRRIAEGSYVIGVIMGFQVAMIDALFADEQGGAPQRFTYVPAEYAPHADAADEDDDPPWPGPLKLNIPAEAVTVHLAPEQRREVRRHQKLKAGGRSNDGPLDGHRMLIRCRVAALLALMHGEQLVSPEMWELARRLVDTSCALRDHLADRVRHAAQARAQQHDKRIVAREAQAETARLQAREQVSTARIARGAAAAARKVQRDGAMHGLTTSDLGDTLKRYRQVKDLCLEHAVDAGWLVAAPVSGTGQAGTRYYLGPRIGEVPSA